MAINTRHALEEFRSKCELSARAASLSPQNPDSFHTRHFIWHPNGLGKWALWSVYLQQGCRNSAHMTGPTGGPASSGSRARCSPRPPCHTSEVNSSSPPPPPPAPSEENKGDGNKGPSLCASRHITKAKNVLELREDSQ